MLSKLRTIDRSEKSILKNDNENMKECKKAWSGSGGLMWGCNEVEICNCLPCKTLKKRRNDVGATKYFQYLKNTEHHVNTQLFFMNVHVITTFFSIFIIII